MTAEVQTPEHIRHIWNQVELVKKLSDQVVKIGPWGVGLDGALAFIPGANLIYGVGAGGLLIAYAIRAEARPATIAKMLGFLALDNATDAVPVIGWGVDLLFRGHLMAARALQKDIEGRYGPMREPRPSTRWGLRKVGQSSAAGPSSPRRR